MFDMKSDLQLVRMGGATLSGTTAANTSLIDMQGFQALTVALTTGTVTDAGTAEGFTLKLQHSDTTVGTDFVDCATSDVIGANLTVTSDDDDDKAIGTIGYRGNKRYVRAVITGTTGTNAVVVVLGIKERAGVRPVEPVADATSAT